MARKLNTLKHKIDALPAEEQEAIREQARGQLDAQIVAHELRLSELRRARRMTQTQLARSLDVSQAQVSRIETQADLYLSTLASYVEAMGGSLELSARFGEGTDEVIALAVGDLVEA